MAPSRGIKLLSLSLSLFSYILRRGPLRGKERMRREEEVVPLDAEIPMCRERTQQQWWGEMKQEKKEEDASIFLSLSLLPFSLD